MAYLILLIYWGLELPRAIMSILRSGDLLEPILGGSPLGVKLSGVVSQGVKPCPARNFGTNRDVLECNSQSLRPM